MRAAAEEELKQAEPSAETQYKMAMVRNATALAVRRLVPDLPEVAG